MGNLAAGPWVDGPPPRVEGVEWIVEIDEKDEDLPVKRMVAWWEEHFKKWETHLVLYAEDAITRHAEIYR